MLIKKLQSITLAIIYPKFCCMQHVVECLFAAVILGRNTIIRHMKEWN